MPERIPSRATAANEPTPEQSDFIDGLDTDFALSDYQVERAANHTEGNSSTQEATISRLLEADDSDFNAGLIQRAGEPTLPGIKVVESITKAPDIDIDKLALVPNTDPIVRKLGTNDKQLYPNRPNTPAEKSAARQAAAATPKPGLVARLKKLIGG